MPAGVSWPTYIKFSLSAGLSMVVGAQTVHQFYRPLEDLEEWVKRFEEQQKIIAEVKGSDIKSIVEVNVSELKPIAEDKGPENKANSESAPQNN